jgi:hypothetical protein
MARRARDIEFKKIEFKKVVDAIVSAAENRKHQARPLIRRSSGAADSAPIFCRVAEPSGALSTDSGEK